MKTKIMQICGRANRGRACASVALCYGDPSLTLEEGAALTAAIANAQTIRDSEELQQRLASVEARLAALTAGATPPALPAPKGDSNAS
jgi:hypothetical protein